MIEEEKPGRHGGDIYKISREYGIQENDILDFSANINPLGVPETVKESIISNINSLVKYPDPECTLLRSQISEYIGVCGSRIITGNGASEIIFLLFEVLRPKRVLIPAPAFSEYERAAGRFGTDVQYFELKDQDDFCLNIDRMLEALSGDTDTIFLCNPNNPTSALAGRSDLLRLIKYAGENGINVIIDETFIEMTVLGNRNSMANCIEVYDNVFIIRAFTKVFAVPGLRLGYGIGNAELIRKMWDRKLPWSVNSFAMDIGKVLEDKDGYLDRTARWLGEEIRWFYDELCSINGLKVFKPSTNFVLVKITDTRFNSQSLKEEFLLYGILIRDASNFKFLDNSYFRLAIKDRKSNARVLETLREVLQKDG